MFLIALGCLFPVYINTYAAIRGVDVKLVEAGQTFGLNRWGLVRRVILPGALPGFLVGLRFALVGCWIIDVVAEEINAQSGLGYLINQAQTTDRTDIMFLCLAIYAILGLVADAIVRLLERQLLAWRRGFAGSMTMTTPVQRTAQRYRTGCGLRQRRQPELRRPGGAARPRHLDRARASSSPCSAAAAPARARCCASSAGSTRTTAATCWSRSAGRWSSRSPG